MNAHDAWERKSNAIDRKLRYGIISSAKALRLHIRNDAAYDDALRIEERAAAGLALADNPAHVTEADDCEQWTE